jgi:hypothetical protein
MREPQPRELKKYGRAGTDFSSDAAALVAVHRLSNQGARGWVSKAWALWRGDMT